jgi:hypothetical protein
MHNGLADDVLSVIREYSRPLTRGDWRRLHRYTNDKFQEDLIVLNYNLYLNIYNNKRNGGYLLENKFKHLYETKKLLYFNGVYYSIVELNELVIVLQKGIHKLYCLYKTDSLEMDGYIYQNVDQIIYKISEFKANNWYVEKAMFGFFIFYYTYLLYNTIFNMI